MASESLLLYFSRRVVDAQTAMDLTAETFAQAIASRRNFRGDDLRDAQGWLFGIAKHLLHRYYRKGSVEQRALEKLEIESRLLSVADREEIEQFVDIISLRTRLSAALADLPEDQRSAVTLRILSGMEYSEISTELGISEAGARKRVSRALGTLRDFLEDEDNE